MLVLLVAAFVSAAVAVVPPQQQQGQILLVPESERPFVVVELVDLVSLPLDWLVKLVAFVPDAAELVGHFVGHSGAAVGVAHAVELQLVGAHCVGLEQLATEPVVLLVAVHVPVFVRFDEFAAGLVVNGV